MVDQLQRKGSDEMGRLTGSAEASTPGRGKIVIGWLALGDEDVKQTVEESASILGQWLATHFPDFSWRKEVVNRPIMTSRALVDPLGLLEQGVRMKIEKRWDFAMVVTDRELLAREQPFIFGAPSSALETAVLSVARCALAGCRSGETAALAQYLFGSLLGLEPAAEGGMRPPTHGSKSMPLDFSPGELERMRERLEDVGDLRLEERGKLRGRWRFRLATFLEDPRGILRDVRGYRPWTQPFRLRRLTAGAGVTALLAFLGAEVWELGMGASQTFLVGSAAIVVLGTTAFLYRGQNLSKATRTSGFSEQVARSEIVLVLCLFTGMASLWLLLFLGCWGLAHVLPQGILSGWIGRSVELADHLRFSAFVSTLATLAGALGGNLEEEDEFKAEFFFDEEV